MLDSLSCSGDSLLSKEAFDVKEIAPENTSKKSYILPLDLVDDESNDQFNNNIDSSSSYQIHSFDENNELFTDENDMEERKEKVGRWTLSSGAAKKVSKSKSSRRNSSHSKPTNMEEERLQIYSESQRLVRESDVHLPVHRPKQFKCFSEFRQSLKGSQSNETKNCEISSQNKLHSDCDTHLQPTIGQSIQNDETQDIKPFTSQGCSVVDHPVHSVDIDCITSVPSLSSDVKPSPDVTSEPGVLTNLLPRLTTRKLKNDEGEEFFIDLGESVPTSVSAVTPNQLLARLKSHLHVSHEKVVRGPIQYSIITKVQSSDAEREELQVETVTHESSKELSTTTSVSRKQWLEHRKILQEKMRQKRLEQYEMRLKEEGTCYSKSKNENTGELSNSDEEWSEGDENGSEISDENSTTDEESSSDSESDEEDEEEGNESPDDDDEDDNAVVGSKKASKHRPCLFADDEAEESENDEVLSEANDLEDEESLICADRADLKQKKSYSKALHANNPTVQSGKNINKSCISQQQHLQLDDFTDLPEETIGFKRFPSYNNGYSFNLAPRHNGALGPADIDLFASECSSILDRTMNPQSILASTRLDATTINDENKSRFTRNSSSHSQWNNTPYELLYSQKPNSQLTSRSESITQEFIDDNPMMISNLHNISSQDTVLLSQEPTQPISEQDPTLILSEEANSSVQSQVLHENRRHLFGESVSDNSELFMDIPMKSSIENDSQVHHENRHNLFGGGSICDKSQVFMDLVTTTKPLDDNDLDSQIDHDDRRNLFGGSIGNESQELDDKTTKLHSDSYVTDSQTHYDNHSQALMNLAHDNDEPDSQLEHEKHRNLFSGSIYGQSQGSINDSANSVVVNNNHNSDSYENCNNLLNESTYDRSHGLVDEMLKPSVNNHSDPELQKSELPTSEFSTQNSSRRRVLVFDDEDDDDDEKENEEKKKIDHIESSSLTPFKSATEFNFTDENLSDNNGVVEAEDEKTSDIDESDNHTVEAEDDDVDEVNTDPDEITDEENVGDDNESSSEGDEEVEQENSFEDDVDDDDEEEVQRLTIQSNEIKKKKKFRVNDFLDEEAELSGDENERAYFMDDENELNPDDDANEEFADLIDEDESNIPSAGRLRRQIERVHHRLQTDQDLRELRYLKELYFEDGDLHAENGRVRQRRFRWRGLDNDDPFADQINMDNSGDDDDNSSDDGKTSIPFGPIDNWLRRCPIKSSNDVNNQSVENDDLNSTSNILHPVSSSSSSNQQINNNNNEDLNNSDEEKENSERVIDNSSTDVLSLGRKALLKSQTKLQTQIIVRNKLPANRGKTTKPSSVPRNSSISNYFLQPKSHNLPVNEGVTNDPDDNSSRIDNVIISDNNHDKPITPVKCTDVNNINNNRNNSDVKLQMIRRGSLLSRLPGSLLPSYKSESTQVHSNVNAEFDVAMSKSENRRDKTNLDLRSRVGLSCFSVVTPQIKPEKIDSFDDNSSINENTQKPSIKKKRSAGMIKSNSVLLSPPSLKRHRSSSVFTALL
ncbi:unnamed protein product [Schistosoma turkestanicum]|nr:unnamed protein product [Schistosoma turkestanicum]